MTTNTNNQKFSIKEIPGIIISSLGVMSLFYGKLDLGLGLQILVEYYSKFRDIIFYPLTFFGIQLGKQYLDFLLIASVFYSSAIRTRYEDSKFSGLCFYGALLTLIPFGIAMGYFAILMGKLSELLMLFSKDEHFHWGIFVIFFIVIYPATIIILSITIFLLFGGVSSFFWALVLIFPPIHKFIPILESIFNKTSNLVGFRYIRKIPDVFHYPGFLLNKIIYLFLPGKGVSYSKFMLIKDDFFSGNLKSNLTKYYVWLSKQLLWVLIAILVFKVIFDTIY